MKRVIVPMLLVGIVLAGCGPQALGEVGQVVTVTGQVESIDLTPMAADGPAEIVLRTESSRQVTVYVASCFGGCAQAAYDQLPEIEAGQTWQATGELQEDGSLSIYTDEGHSLSAAG
jgi:hypothetical protein